MPAPDRDYMAGLVRAVAMLDVKRPLKPTRSNKDYLVLDFLMECGSCRTQAVAKVTDEPISRAGDRLRRMHGEGLLVRRLRNVRHRKFYHWDVSEAGRLFAITPYERAL